MHIYSRKDFAWGIIAIIGFILELFTTQNNPYATGIHWLYTDMILVLAVVFAIYSFVRAFSKKAHKNDRPDE